MRAKNCGGSEAPEISSCGVELVKQDLLEEMALELVFFFLTI